MWRARRRGACPATKDGSDDGSPDVFIVSGAEDLVPVADDARGRVRYRPRSEGLFARIEHVRDDTGDYWEVRSRDGLLTRYGTPRPTDAAPDWRDPAVTDDRASGGRGRVFAWRITETTDAVGNLVRYSYARDHGEEPGHAWDQPIVSRIEYADYGDRADPSFLVRVDFEYEQRPDPFSDYRSGFEIRTTLRCSTIRVSTHAADGVARAVREYRFGYEQAPFNGASLLTRVEVVGVDDQSGPPRSEHLPPLTFGYTAFEPQRRRFGPVTGAGLPTRPLGDPTMAMVDLRGRGLPDIVELGATARYWRNLGGGRFDLPRAIPEAPPQRLGEPGVQFIDADGDGRADLLVKSATQAGYFPMTFDGGWSRRSFQPYRQAPTVGLDDPHVKLVDLDGDGLTDVVRSGSSLQCWFNDADPRRAWQRTAVTNGPAAGIDLADPHVRLADMTGDGLQDVVLLRSGNIAYWPNLGHGRFGVARADAPGAAAARRARPAPAAARRRRRRRRRRPRLRRPRTGAVVGQPLRQRVDPAAGHRDRNPRRGEHRRRAVRRPARHRDGRAAVQPRRRWFPPGHVAVPRRHRRPQAAPAQCDGQPPRRTHHGGVRPLHAVPPRRRDRPGHPVADARCRSRCTSSPGSRCTTRSPPAG